MGTMNEIIMGLYEIEEQAGQIMENAAKRKQKLAESNRKQREDSVTELERELEGRLTILRSQLETQTEEELESIVKKNQEQIAQLNERCEKNLNQIAEKIVEKITEV